MQIVFTSPYTLLLVLTIVTIWYYEKSETLEFINFPPGINGDEISADSVTIAFKANPKAAIYYTVNGKKKSMMADYDGYGNIYHYFNEDKLELIIYADKKYNEEVKKVSLTKSAEVSEKSFTPAMVFDKPYYDIAKNTSMNYFVEDDYILVDIKTPENHPSESMAYIDYLIADFSYSIDLYKKENNIYRTIYRINNRIVNM